MRFFAIAAAFNIFTVIAAATDFTQQARFSSGAAGQYASIGVGISGNTAVVASEAGYYVYIRSGTIWSQQTILIPSDGMAGCGFPQRAAIDGNTIVVGCASVAIGGNANQGAAYVFYRDGANWSQQQRLTASDGAAADRLGRSVAIKGDTVVIGAVGNDIGANTDQGSAYVFQRNGGVWAEQAILLADNPAAFNYLGQFVSMDTNVLAVSNGPQPGAGSNAVYVFVRSGNTWTFQQRLTNCEPSGSDGYCPFGGSTAIQGDRLLVGNTSLNVGSNQFQGGVYFYSRSGSIWTQQQRLTAADGLPSDNFGSSLAVNGDTLIVGATADDFVRTGKVDIYIFDGTQWPFHQRLSSGFGMRDSFGQNLSFDGSSLIVASPREGAGAAYVFARPIINLIRSPFDFDGDSKTDVSIFRPGPGEWWWSRSSDGGNRALTFGTSTDTPVPADFTGDGKSDIAFFRPSTGYWFVLRSEDSSFFATPFGLSGDVPVPTDFDADGKADIAVFRSSNSTWYINNSGGSPTTIQQFGIAGDVPVAADYDGDGKSDIAIYRPNAAGGGQWWIQRSSTNVVAALQFGTSTDKTVPGDFTGDGKADIAFWRPSTGFWYVLRSEDLSFFAFPFGTTGDVPVPGDYDGDGKYDAGVFRTSNSTWYVQRSTAGTLIQQFGITGDLPVPNAFLR